MDIIVCIKQVPGSDSTEINQVNHTIVRSHEDSIINPYDLFALEQALRIKEKCSGKVTVLSMGIPSVKTLLKKTIAMGADRAVLLTDPAFAGSDTLATARVLASAISKINTFNLVICGKQAIDGDTAQVGPALAEKLGIPDITAVNNIKEVSKSSIQCSRFENCTREIVKVSLPALVTITKSQFTPRLIKPKGIIRANRTTIDVWDNSTLKVPGSQCGLNGSPTRVIKINKPEQYNNDRIEITGSPASQARELHKLLLNRVNPT